MLIKRNTMWLQGPLLLGIGASIPRYLAIAKEKKDTRYGATIVMGMNILVLAVSMLPLLFSFLPRGKETIATWLFGSEKYAFLVIPLIVYNFSLILGLIILKYLQGISSLNRFSLFNAINMALLPLTLIIVFRVNNVTMLCYALAVGSAVLPLYFISIWLFKNFKNIEWKMIIPITKPALLYGCTRVPGDLALGGLMAMPALTTAHLTSIRWGGVNSFALSLLQIGGTLFAPLGIFLLPKMSTLIARGAKDDICRVCQKSLILSFILAAALSLCLFIGINLILHFGLGDDFFFGKGAVMSILLAVLPYSMYVILRSILDGLAVRAFNTENVFYGLISFCILGLGIPFGLEMKDAEAIAMTIGASFSFSMTLVAGLSVWRLRQVIARI